MYIVLNSIGKTLECGDIAHCRDHLGDEQEPNGEHEQQGGNADNRKCVYFELIMHVPHDLLAGNPIDQDIEADDRQPHRGIKQEEDKILLVELAHAVASPWAVVVHPQYALPAH